MSSSSVLQQAVVPLQQSSSLLQALPGISYRNLQPKDFNGIKAAHASLFPIDYDDTFFIKATHGLDRIWSCAAVVTDPYGAEQLIGFITAKSVMLHEVDASDRQHMGLLSGVLDHDPVLYVMTLGVLEAHRHRGLATNLIAIACQHAYETRCRAVFLHVITYNTSAMSLYSRQGFRCVAKLRAFYYIATGRTPDPNQQVYDAYLFVQCVGGAAGVPSPWDLISLAWSPFRLAFNRIHACMPGFCSAAHLVEPHPHQQPLVSEEATPGWSHLNSSNTQQQQQQTGVGFEHRQQQQQPWQYQQLHEQQQQQQQQQQLVVQPWYNTPQSQLAQGSRHRHRGPSLPDRQQRQQQHSHVHHTHYQEGHQQPVQLDMQQQQDEDMQPAPPVQQTTKRHRGDDHHHQQQQQQSWQQLDADTTTPWQQQQQRQRHWQQHAGDAAAAQPGDQPYMLHASMQPPQQRMLRWLFNGASRGSSSSSMGQQQALDAQHYLTAAALQQQQQQRRHSAAGADKLG